MYFIIKLRTVSVPSPLFLCMSFVSALVVFVYSRELLRARSATVAETKYYYRRRLPLLWPEFRHGKHNYRLSDKITVNPAVPTTATIYLSSSVNDRNTELGMGPLRVFVLVTDIRNLVRKTFATSFDFDLKILFRLYGGEFFRTSNAYYVTYVLSLSWIKYIRFYSE